ncbi:MAG: hypothetical protein HWD61_08165 [Parachlamydiaceae bacterium]|nr:MAG: hypothetical protein HWD61_08165 [Parachlamydiaceae bacterium]
MAAGITLAAALATPGALAGGISLICFGVILWGIAELYRAGRVIVYERMSKESSYQNLGCRSDFSDLPEIEYLSEKHDVTIKLTRRQIESYPFKAAKIGFLPEKCENKVKHPFLLVLKQLANQLSASVLVYDSQLKKKVFTIDLDGRLLHLSENPLTVAEIEKI